MIEIPIKPLTANRMWKGRRFKSTEYKTFQTAMVALLNRSGLVIPDGRLTFEVEAGVSGRFDLDNVIKSTLDTIQLHDPNFNDVDVFRIVATKILKKPRDEYLAFNLTQLED